MRPALLILASLFFSSAASADLPPPDGRKNVPYGFTVTGLTLAPDRVMFAYPCGGSDGAPMAELTKIEEGKTVSVGRRGGSCALYTIDKASWDLWSKSYVAKMESTNPAADQLVAKSVKCAGAPSPQFETTTADKRTSIQEKLQVAMLSATTCTVQSMGINSSAAAAAPPAPSGKSGCAFSAQSTHDASALALAALAGAVVLMRRRR